MLRSIDFGPEKEVPHVSEAHMTIVQHLNELRKRIMITLASFLVFFVIGFIYIKDIYNWFVKDMEFQLTVLGPGEIIWIYFTIAAVIAAVGTIPIVALQIWLFVRPALKKKEQSITLMYVPASFFLFVLGWSFGHFIILPVVLNFLMGLTGDMFETMFTIEKYFKFIMHMTIPFAVLFELPVVIMFLTSLGIINPIQMKKVRKYAYFVLIVISVVISPPDFLSDVLVIIPLLVLYEFSIFLSGFVYRRKLKKAQKEAA